jgi:plasmid stability protein
MGQVLIRNIPDDVIEKLKRKAEINGHSLEQELREIITRAAPFTPQERVELSKRILSMQKTPSKLRSEDMLRKDRDSR